VLQLQTANHSLNNCPLARVIITDIHYEDRSLIGSHAPLRALESVCQKPKKKKKKKKKIAFKILPFFPQSLGTIHGVDVK
jgi:hypothetical protein